MPKKLLIFAIAILILLGGVVFVWQKKIEQRSIQRNQETESQFTTNTKQDFLAMAEPMVFPSVNTSDWNEYHNTKMGFSTKLPKGWLETLNEEGQIVCFGTKDTRYVQEESLAECPVTIELGQSEETLVQDLNQWKEQKVILKLKKTLINGKELFIVESEPNESVYFNQDGKFWNAQYRIGVSEIQETFFGIMQNFSVGE